MAFVVPKSKASTKDGLFQFGPKTGREFSVPKMQYMRIDQAADLSMFMSGQMVAGSLRQALEALFGEDAGKYVATLDREQITALMDAWSEASDVDPGESEPSETSSPSTEGQSGQPA